MWGTSSSNLYFISEDGEIVHYDGEEFVLMDSGTDISLTDIWGLDNEHIWVTGEQGDYSESVLLFYDGTDWQQIHHYHWLYGNEGETNLTGRIRTVWADEDMIFLGGGGGIWSKRLEDTDWNFIHSTEIHPDGMYPRKIRGERYNDVMCVGNSRKQYHFNGAGWVDVTDNGSPSSYQLWSVDIKNGFTVAVGMSAYEFNAIAIRGYRQ